MKKKAVKALIIAGSIILTLFFLILLGWKKLDDSVGDICAIPVHTPHFAIIPEGKYIGEYTAGPVYVKTEATIENGKLTEVVILQHSNGLGGKAESIVENIIEEQSLDVDAVSGATVSSKCIMKAVENALENGAH